MHQLVPHFILQQMAEDNHQGEFAAAALFLDLNGFATLTDTLMQHEQHGAEVLAAVIKAIFDELVMRIYHHGGFIATFAGDAFLALFPAETLLSGTGPTAAPAAGENSLAAACGRALAAAWRIQEHLVAHSEHTTPYGTFEVTAKIGLASGRIDWGLLFSADGSEAAYYFKGPAVDGCTAAEHEAGRSEIILTVDFNDLTAGLQTAERLDNHYRLLGVSRSLPGPQEIDQPAPDPELLARFFPREVILQQQSGEFRQIVNMFISLPTVTAHEQMAILSQAVFELTTQYGGVFNRFDFGDKGAYLCLFWGMPVTHETDVQRALSFILALRSRTSIPIKAGITYRIAYAGFSGSPVREEYTAYGRGVNLAARFMIDAPRGEVWVDEAAARRAAEQFDLEYEGELAFKGFAVNQKVYLLLARKEAVELSATQPLLGRQEELRQLVRFIDPLFDHRAAGTLILWGEAGIGKSRLVAALLQTIEEKEPAVQSFYCQADEILLESLNPFRYWLRHYFGQSNDASQARNKHAFNRKLDNLINVTAEPGLVEELDRTRSCLGALVDLYWADSLYAQLDPQGRFDNTLIALTTLLQAESLRQPVLLLVEDAHWLDDDSSLYLQTLERSLQAPENVHYPLALLITARVEQAQRIFEEETAVQQLELDYLTSEAVSGLAASILQGPVTPHLNSLLLDRSEGNPFFAEQLVRYLQEEELLTRTDAGWDVSGEQRRLLPEDVRTVLVARLDRLAEQVKEGVERAAVLGREFDLRLLSMMLNGEATLTDMLEDGEKAIIWSALSQLRYIFRHALLRDAAYRIQLHARRQELHRLAAAAFSSLFSADLSPYYGELAYHTERGGLIEDARRYLRLAGDAARETYANSLAIDYYSRALNLTPASDLEARYALLCAREEIHDMQGSRPEQAADLDALAGLAEALDDATIRAEVSLRRSEYALNTGAYQEAIAAAQEAISWAQESEDLVREAAGHRQLAGTLRMQGAYDAARNELEQAADRALAADAGDVWANTQKELGVIAYYRGDYTLAQGYFDEALLSYRSQKNRRGETLCLHHRALVAMDMADYERARADSQEALGIARDLGDRRTESLCVNNLASIARREYDFTGSQAHYEHSAAIYREINDRRGHALCLNNLGLVACDMGDYASAGSYLEEALRLYRAIGNRRGEGVCLNNLGILAHDLGEHNQARDYLQQGLTVCRAIGYRTIEGTILNELGLVEIDRGQLDQARTLFEEALALRTELGQTYYLVEDQAGLALAALARGAPDEARAALEDVLVALENDPDLPGAERPLNVHLTAFQVLQATDDARARPVLERAYHLLQARAARIDDETIRRSFLQNVPAHAEIVLQYEED